MLRPMSSMSCAVDPVETRAAAARRALPTDEAR
jgi:hypothetical protein